MKKVLTLIFGERAEGVLIQQPTLKTIMPTNRPSEQEWGEMFKFGSRYGHRGSFYDNKSTVVRLATT